MANIAFSKCVKCCEISKSALNRWRRQFLVEQQGITPTAPAISAEQREIQRLRAENEQLRNDNVLLKKVSAFLLEKF